MRAILLVLILAIVALIGAVASGLISLNLTRPAQAPQLSATGNGVTAKGGQTPAFEVETGSVKLGTKDATVKVPTLGVERASKGGVQVDANAQAPADNVAGM
ncbi:MAG: hypothetical protein ABIQ32_14060 [Sphingomicrobium sp.]